MRRLYDVLGSTRLTLGLLLAMAGLLGAGLLIPQRAVLQRQAFEEWAARYPGLVSVLDGTGLTDVYRSPLATLLWSAFFLNLLVVMWRRVPVVRRRIRVDGEIPDPSTAPQMTYRRTAAVHLDSMEPVAEFFAARGYAVHREGTRLRAVKNRLSPVATLLFHVSFTVVAAGALVSALTRFEGRVDLGVGEEFTGALAQYADRPSLPRIGGAPSVRFLVEGIEPEVVGNLPVRLRVFVRDENYRGHVVEVNQPYEVGNASFVFMNLGVAPALVFTEPGGGERFAGLVKLNVLQDRVDQFDLLGMRFSARLFPDYVREGGTERSRSQEMRDPVLRLEAERKGGRTAASLRPGERAVFGPYVVTFADWRYWARFYVRAEHGMGIVWAGFAIGVVALAWRLLLFRREFVVAAGAAGVEVAGRSEFYRHLFEDEGDTEVGLLEAALARADRRDG